MAVESLRTLGQLEEGWILAPERYDPRRLELLSSAPSKDTTAIEDVAEVMRGIVNPTKLREEKLLVLDTSNAEEGIIVNSKPAVAGSDVGSAKKRVEPGDVIISRLRPYLRQVALVDNEMRFLERGCGIVCSTEFFVLRSRGEESIAFLVPFLLSEKVQSVLAASQEGGHHPRFNESTLLNLRIAKNYVKERSRISDLVELAVKRHREAERLIAESIVAYEASCSRLNGGRMTK